MEVDAIHDRSGPHQLRFGALGPLEVWRDGAVVKLDAPKQRQVLGVLLANAGFLPSAAEVEHARHLLEAYEKASASGVAAIEFEGQMVDEPLAARARQILAAAGADEENA